MLILTSRKRMGGVDVKLHALSFSGLD